VLAGASPINDVDELIAPTLDATTVDPRSLAVGYPSAQVVFGVPGTGKHTTVKGMLVDRVVAGKMAESQILMDDLSMMRQLGVIPG
jgi:hypothetical protein